MNFLKQLLKLPTHRPSSLPWEPRPGPIAQLNIFYFYITSTNSLHCFLAYIARAKHISAEDGLYCPLQIRHLHLDLACERQTFLLTPNWSTEHFHCSSYCLRMTDKRRQRSNVNAMNLQQNSQYVWNIVFPRRSIWVLLELIRRWTQHFSKIDQEKRKIEQICIWNPMTTRFIM